MEYSIGQIVIAKLKGYEPWPAKIIQINDL